MTEFVTGRFVDYISRDVQWRQQSASAFASPIEALFWMWWNALIWAHEVPHASALLRPQFEVDLPAAKYRVDFAVQADDTYVKAVADALGTVPRIAIELDGHEWHERTKDQVIYRNQRDRDLQAAGWVVLHYSGSELVRAPYETVSEAHSKVDAIFYDYGVQLVEDHKRRQ